MSSERQTAKYIIKTPNILCSACCVEVTAGWWKQTGIAILFAGGVLVILIILFFLITLDHAAKLNMQHLSTKVEVKCPAITHAVHNSKTWKSQQGAGVIAGCCLERWRTQERVKPCADWLDYSTGNTSDCWVCSQHILLACWLSTGGDLGHT
ncbi:hypothetical protein BDN71DRAFT_1430360 [Pleurotus eryngii]|uniref:Uncharacterized protein n=1 Tax=Pleurotus eryngii TaxID=5323 RepID=A0A9P5ZXR5_PLEER|nr:hypothetical protein BDN71DRAFT_1430360 [Pleurotus eryngii]